MPFVILVALALVGATIRVLVRSTQHIAEPFLLYLLAIPVGLGGMLGFVGHTVRADQTAMYIGWPAGNPFQLEVGVANLPFALLGLLCIWIRGHFWTATCLGFSTFLLGAGVVHLHERGTRHNLAPGNAGPVLYLDLLLPVLMLALLFICNRRETRKDAE
jgi:hypothetical protein